MAGRLGDQRGPLAVVGWWRDVGLVVKGSLVAGRQCSGHEAQFHDWTHVDRAQEIVDLIGVVERIDQLVALFDDGIHVVVEQTMETHMAKAKRFPALLQLGLPVRAKRERGMTAANAMFPEVRQGFGLGGKVAGETRGHGGVARRSGHDRKRARHGEDRG